MSGLKRCLTSLLCLLLVASFVPTAQAAGSFAAFYITADSMAFPERTLHVEVFRRDADGAFTPVDAVRYSCQINQVAGNASFDILAQSTGVQVTVDYLTDLNQDGIYELLDGQDVSAADTMTRSNKLAPLSASSPAVLETGEVFTLTAKTLAARGEAAVEARRAGGEHALPSLQWTDAPDPCTILYLITLRAPAEDGSAQELCYYLQLYDSVILPADVPANSWYRQGAQYALERGFLSGTAPDTFSPNGGVTRAQLAQILWRLGGSQKADDPGCSDVTSDAWFYQAASWCCDTGLMAPADGRFLPDRALTREELALILHRFAQNEGKRTKERRSADDFSDGSSVSSWARDSVEWAAAMGFLSGYEDGTLRPANGITRAELAVVMRKYCLDLKL